MRSAYAHDGLLHVGEPGLWNAWTLDPFVVVPLALAAWLYWKGSPRFGARQACFAGGMVALVLALVWPLDALGEQLFSAHMAQHLVLMNVAAPLLVLGVPLAALLRALPLGWRRGLVGAAARRPWRATWRWLSGIAVATLLQQVALWGWHTPGGVAAALQSEPLHIAMHATLLAAALVFWTAVLRPPGGSYWAPLAAVLATLKVSGVVCIVLLLQPHALYAAYGDAALAWGLAPAQDEQLGWALMLVVGGTTYLGAAVALLAAAFARLEGGHPAAGPAEAVRAGDAGAGLRRQPSP